jgi:hypothetical protein
MKEKFIQINLYVDREKYEKNREEEVVRVMREACDRIQEKGLKRNGFNDLHGRKLGTITIFR